MVRLGVTVLVTALIARLDHGAADGIRALGLQAARIGEGVDATEQARNAQLVV